MAGYNRTRTVEQLLERTESSPPSFAVHLHTEYWILNHGSKFLYNNQIASLLDDIRAHRIPVDFLELFDLQRVPFYDGCMIVELLDYRPQKMQEPALKNPQRTRVVLHPNPETLWADICSLNQREGSKWTDKIALEVEAKLLLLTAPPLCLDPDPHLTRIVNHVLRVSTPSMPLSLKRKATNMEPEEDGPEKAKRERLLTFMAPRDNRLHAPSYRMLDVFKKANEASSAVTPILPGNQYMNVNPQPQTPVAPPTPAPQSHSPIDTTAPKAKKMNTPQLPSFNVAYTRSNGSHTPVPPQPTHQFVNQHPPAAAAPIMQPQVYASVQAATEAAKRAPTPALQHQMQIQQQQQYYQMQQQQQLHQQQQQPQPQQTQGQLQQRPPSQPQHSVSQQHPQQAAAQQVQQQRFTQSPKPPAAASPVRTQPSPQPYAAATPAQFQPPIPSTHFLSQPPSGSRTASKPQIPITNSAHQHQHQQQTGPSQPNHAQQFQLYNYQQRLAAANGQKNGVGGRATPQMQPNQAQQQQQQSQHSLAAVAATPSPVRGSPLVANHQIPGAAGARSSPLPAKAQIPSQGQQQPQQQQVPQSHPQMQPPRVTFTSQYNPNQLRPLVHGNNAPPQGHMTANGGQGQATNVTGTPTMAAASPRIAGRPITPVIVGVGADGKQQQQQQQAIQMQMQAQQPIRRQTPLQQAQHQLQAQQQQVLNAAASPQAQHQLQAQQQQVLNAAASPQAQHTNQAQVQAQAQQAAQQHHAQSQQPLSQTQTQTLAPAQQQQLAQNPQQQQQMAQRYQMYATSYQQYPMHLWRASGTPQQQQHGVSGGQAMMVNVSGGQPQHQQSMMQAQQAQAALQIARQNAAAMVQQGMSMGSQPGPAVVSRMPVPMQAQVQAALGKGKVPPKKSKGPPPR